MKHNLHPTAAERHAALDEWRSVLAANPTVPLEISPEDDVAWAQLRATDDESIAEWLNVPYQAAAARAVAAWRKLPPGINTLQRAERHGYSHTWAEMAEAVQAFNVIASAYLSMVSLGVVDTTTGAEKSSTPFRALFDRVTEDHFLWDADVPPVTSRIANTIAQVYAIQDGGPHLRTVRQADPRHRNSIAARDTIRTARDMNEQHATEYHDYLWCVDNDQPIKTNGAIQSEQAARIAAQRTRNEAATKSRRDQTRRAREDASLRYARPTYPPGPRG